MRKRVQQAGQEGASRRIGPRVHRDGQEDELMGAKVVVEAAPGQGCDPTTRRRAEAGDIRALWMKALQRAQTTGRTAPRGRENGSSPRGERRSRAEERSSGRAWKTSQNASLLRLAEASQEGESRSPGLEERQPRWPEAGYGGRHEAKSGADRQMSTLARLGARAALVFGHVWERWRIYFGASR